MTGAASGIGRAVALELAAQRVALTLLDRDPTGLEEAVAAVATVGAPVPLAVTVDVSDRSALADALQQASAAGPLDGLVSAAGILEAGGLTDTLDESWQRHLAVNTT